MDTDHKDPGLDPAALLRPGAALLIEMADFDACDFYKVRIDACSEGDGVAFSYWFGHDPQDDDGAEPLSQPEDRPPEDMALATAAALAEGDGVLFLSQGSLCAAEERPARMAVGYQQHTPPFLVSRAVHATLKAGGSARLRLYGEDSAVKVKGTEVQPLRWNDRDLKVPVLRAVGDDLTVWLLDHPRWPLLLRAEFQGDNYIILHAIDTSTAR